MAEKKGNKKFIVYPAYKDHIKENERLRQLQKERLNNVTLNQCKEMVKTLEGWVNQSVKLKSEPNVLNGLADLQKIVNRKNPSKESLKECYIVGTVYLNSWKRYM